MCDVTLRKSDATYPTLYSNDRVWYLLSSFEARRAVVVSSDHRPYTESCTFKEGEVERLERGGKRERKREMKRERGRGRGREREAKGEREIYVKPCNTLTTHLVTHNKRSILSLRH
ncbi:hypothetical protein J6590_096117 [Homalodisca vitripennis]|nr:hypothetical protein J6590_096117 [Homalodisca vitripennis]